MFVYMDRWGTGQQLTCLHLKTGVSRLLVNSMGAAAYLRGFRFRSWLAIYPTVKFRQSSLGLGLVAFR